MVERVLCADLGKRSQPQPESGQGPGLLGFFRALRLAARPIDRNFDRSRDWLCEFSVCFDDYSRCWRCADVGGDWRRRVAVHSALFRHRVLDGALSAEHTQELAWQAAFPRKMSTLSPTHARQDAQIANYIPGKCRRSVRNYGRFRPRRGRPTGVRAPEGRSLAIERAEKSREAAYLALLRDSSFWVTFLHIRICDRPAARADPRLMPRDEISDVRDRGRRGPPARLGRVCRPVGRIHAAHAEVAQWLDLPLSHRVADPGQAGQLG